ncbi:MAG: phosphoglycolate phosphatase [Parvibaculaceae bacterium]
MQRAAIFDLDGTLVDTAPDLWHATNHVLTSLGRRAISLDEVRAFVGHGARTLLARGLAATGESLPAPEIEPLFHQFIDYYRDNIAQESVPFPGCLALLDRLAADGIKLGVCTNKLEGLSVRLLEELDMTRYFGAIIGPDTIGIAKPDAAPYRETLNRLGINGGPSVMVGDSETDVLTARAASVPIIAVTFGYTSKPIAETNPDHLIDRFDEAYPLIVNALDS